MDFTLSLSSDWFNLLSIPLILITIKDVIPHWKTIWDKNLTMEDRRHIMRIVIFLALPVVVFVHEVGHLLAALEVGARVYEFHYGPVTGHVRVQSDIAPEKLLWIAVAGNLAQVIMGLLSLLLAAVVRSAPMVAFLVYLGLFAIGDTVIFYAALSLASIYGDWVQIYNNPSTNLVVMVGIAHAFLILFVIYCINGSLPRTWFTRKTMPGWSAHHEKLEQAARRDPNLKNCVSLADSFIEAGLYKEAADMLRRAELQDPGNPGVEYSKAHLEMNRGNIDKAMESYEKLACNQGISDPMRAQIFLQMGEIWLYRRSAEKALDCFDSAARLDESLGDPKLQRSILRANMQNYAGLQEDIKALKNPEIIWVYTRNKQTAAQEIEKLESILADKKV